MDEMKENNTVQYIPLSVLKTISLKTLYLPLFEKSSLMAVTLINLPDLAIFSQEAKHSAMESSIVNL